MLSRYISRSAIQSSRFFKSVNLYGSCIRNQHVVACDRFAEPAKIENKSHKLLINPLALQRISSPHFELKRNFSLTPTVSASAVAASSQTDAVLPIPDVPTPLPSVPIEEVAPVVVQALTPIGEPTFASLDLGGYSPVGILQSSLEYLHVSCDLPWYATIIASTFVIRMLLTPIVVKSQQNAALMRNIMPEMQEIQNKITEARQMGNAVAYAEHNQELIAMMQSKGVNPIKNLLVPMAQVPIFLSYFIGIRGMVNAPVESLQTGGTLWFTDLTLADPYYLLPLITCSTLALTLKIASDARVQQVQMMSFIMNALPIITFPFIMNFPSALVLYWASSNTISLMQCLFFKVPSVRKFFNIPQITKVSLAASKKEGVVNNMKGAWSNLKLSREIEDRRRLDQINLQRAKGPIARTYKFEPENTKTKKAEN